LRIATPDGAIDRIRRGHLNLFLSGRRFQPGSGAFSEVVSFAMRLRRMFAFSRVSRFLVLSEGEASGSASTAISLASALSLLIAAPQRLG
jgi:hypothetical protein